MCRRDLYICLVFSSWAESLFLMAWCRHIHYKVRSWSGRRVDDACVHDRFVGQMHCLTGRLCSLYEQLVNKHSDNLMRSQHTVRCFGTYTVVPVFVTCTSKRLGLSKFTDLWPFWQFAARTILHFSPILVATPPIYDSMHWRSSPPCFAARTVHVSKLGFLEHDRTSVLWYRLLNYDKYGISRLLCYIFLLQSLNIINSLTAVYRH